MKTMEHPKTCPVHYKWRTIGLKRHGDYIVKYWRNIGPTKHAHASSLTEARKMAVALIREDSATYCEVYRYAENGVSIYPFLQVEYSA